MPRRRRAWFGSVTREASGRRVRVHPAEVGDVRASAGPFLTGVWAVARRIPFQGIEVEPALIAEHTFRSSGMYGHSLLGSSAPSGSIQPDGSGSQGGRP